MRMRRAVGIIIGGTRISLGVVNSEGTIEAQIQLDTNPLDGFEAAIERMTASLHDICAGLGVKSSMLAGIGVGSTGPVDTQTGLILTDFTLPSWGGSNIVERLEELFHLPVLLENDVDAAVLGEAFIDKQSHHSIVLLTFGTGVGGAVLLDGEIYRGAHGEHPEIGHVLVRSAGPLCYCGVRGCLEMAASGTAIARAGKRFGIKDSREVFARAKGGDERAKKIVDSAIESVTIGVWTILHTLLPERVILGGGIMDEHYYLFEPSIREMLDKATMIPKNGVVLAKARPGNEAGIVGAASLSFRHAPR